MNYSVVNCSYSLDSRKLSLWQGTAERREDWRTWGRIERQKYMDRELDRLTNNLIKRKGFMPINIFLAEYRYVSREKILHSYDGNQEARRRRRGGRRGGGRKRKGRRRSLLPIDKLIFLSHVNAISSLKQQGKSSLFHHVNEELCQLVLPWAQPPMTNTGTSQRESFSAFPIYFRARKMIIKVWSKV